MPVNTYFRLSGEVSFEIVERFEAVIVGLALYKLRAAKRFVIAYTRFMNLCRVPASFLSCIIVQRFKTATTLQFVDNVEKRGYLFIHTII